MTVRIGTSGWSYPHWRGVLYQGVPQSRWLERYAEEFDTVELNGSFYRWPREDAFSQWASRVPAGFSFSVKAARGLSHARRLRDPEVWFERVTSAWRALDGRTGIFLIQLPPDFERDDDRLEYALKSLPDGVRAAIEFRHPSWVSGAEPVFALLERYGVAYCVMSGAGLPCVLRRTAPFVYVRLHGPDHQHLYAGSYSDTDLSWWAERITQWRDSGAEVFAYFNNDGEGHAVRNARTLRALLVR